MFSICIRENPVDPPFGPGRGSSAMVSAAPTLLLIITFWLLLMLEK